MSGSITRDEYRAVLDNVGDGVFVVARGRIVYYNHPLLNILELEPQQATLKRICDMFAGAEKAPGREVVKRLADTEPFDPARIEIITGKGHGKTVDVSSHSIAVRKTPVLQVIVKDRTREYSVETEFDNATTLFNSVFDAIDEAIFVLDESDFTLRNFSLSAGRMFKIDADGLKGDTLWHLMAEPSRAGELVRKIRGELPERGRLRLEFDMRRGDGAVFPALHSIAEMKDRQGRKIGLMWVVTDVTRQTYLNHALAEVETHYRILFDRAGDPTFIIDTETKQIIDINQAVMDQLGYSRQELIGKTIYDITAPDHHRELSDDFGKVARDKFAVIQSVSLTKDQRRVPVQMNLVITTFGKRKVYIAASRDISHQLEIQRERMRAEKLETVRQVAGGIAHEFSQPLQGLMSIAELLQDPAATHELHRRLVPKIVPLVHRMNHLLNQMKGIVRLVTKPYVDENGIVDLGRSTRVPRMLIFDPRSQFERSALRAAMMRGIEPEVTDDYDVAMRKLEEGQFDLLMCNPRIRDPRMKSFLRKVSLLEPGVSLLKVSGKGRKGMAPSESDLIEIIDRALSRE